MTAVGVPLGGIAPRRRSQRQIATRGLECTFDDREYAKTTQLIAASAITLLVDCVGAAGEEEPPRYHGRRWTLVLGKDTAGTLALDG